MAQNGSAEPKTPKKADGAMLTGKQEHCTSPLPSFVSGRPWRHMHPSLHLFETSQTQTPVSAYQADLADRASHLTATRSQARAHLPASQEGNH